MFVHNTYPSLRPLLQGIINGIMVNLLGFSLELERLAREGVQYASRRGFDCDNRELCAKKQSCSEGNIFTVPMPFFFHLDKHR